MVYTIDSIRQTAEESLCEKCFPIYKAVIEPKFRAMFKEYFHDWQGIESVVRGLVLKDLGTFDNYQMFMLDFDEKPREKLAEFMNVDIYETFKKKYPRFPHRIDYLLKHGIIGDNLHSLLAELNTRRNKIHRLETGFSDPLRIAFSYARSWLEQLHLYSVDSGINKDVKRMMNEAIERSAAQLLIQLKQSDSGD
jgi:hypothetical protein